MECGHFSEHEDSQQDQAVQMKKNECGKAYSECEQQQTLLSLDWKIACVLIHSQDSDSQEEKMSPV